MTEPSSTHESFHREEVIQGSSDRTFGLVFTVFFAVVGLLPLVRAGSPRLWALYASGAFLLVALAFPRLLHPLNVLWMRFGLLLHKITNPIILGVLFYAVFTPFAIVIRLIGKDLLRLRPRPGQDSYWLLREPPGPARDSITRQF